MRGLFALLSSHLLEAPVAPAASGPTGRETSVLVEALSEPDRSFWLFLSSLVFRIALSCVLQGVLISCTLTFLTRPFSENGVNLHITSSVKGLKGGLDL